MTMRLLNRLLPSFGRLHARKDARANHKNTVIYKRSLPEIFSLQNRHLSSSEAIAALRPFYFAVHPDLFSQYPKIRDINEQSLKLLHEHLNLVETTRHYANSLAGNLRLTFYLRQELPLSARTAESGTDRSDFADEKQKFHCVQLSLNLKGDIYGTIIQILNECRLPTEHLAGLKRVVSAPASPGLKGGLPAGWNDYDEEQLKWFWRRKVNDIIPKKDLKHWIKTLEAESKKKKEAYEATNSELENSIEKLKSETGLLSIKWSSDWGLSYCRGCLLSLKRVMNLEDKVSGMIGIRNKKIRFGSRGTFVGLDGSLNLGVQDVPEEWIKLIRTSSAPGFQNIFEEIKSCEEELSHLLGGVEVKGAVDTPVGRYLTWLRGLSQRLKTNGFPPEILTGSDLTVVIQSEADGCVLSSTGEIRIPANCSRQELTEFLNINVPIAKSLKVQGKKMTELLEVGREKCIENLKLTGLSWDSCLKGEDLLGCIDRLEDGKFEFLKGKNLFISGGSSYLVLDDGKISIPLHWE